MVTTSTTTTLPTATTSTTSTTSTTTTLSCRTPATSTFSNTVPNRPTTCPLADDSTLEDAAQDVSRPNSAEHRGNWLPCYTINTDYSEDYPDTGKTRTYSLTISKGTGVISGVSKQVLMVNNQFPGPLIRADWGDFLEVTVTNNLAANGTDLHWQGFRQLNNNVQDGVNGVTECPIAPGGSKTYRFRATQYGTSYYHSLFSVQQGDGVFGPIIIDGPSSANYDVDLGAVIVSDAYPKPIFQTYYDTVRKGPSQASNYLLNGQNIALDGTSGVRPSFTFTPGLKHRIRIINAASIMFYKMQIDSHVLQVIESDFVPLVPYTTQELSIAGGQRYDIIVEADQAIGNYFFRALAAQDCDNTANDGTGTANGIITYEGAADPAQLPTSSPWPHTNTCVDELSCLVSVVQTPVDSSSFASDAQQLAVDIQVITNPDFMFSWMFRGISQVVDWRQPAIISASSGNTAFNNQNNVIQLNQANMWNFFVIQNRFFVPHSLHLHGHDVSILGSGTGNFDAATDTAGLNFNNPPRRDTFYLLASGWTVIAFVSDNPGLWLLLSQSIFEAGEGLGVLFLERPADIPSLYATQVQSSEYQNQCDNWASFYKTAPFLQFDSGL